MVISTPLSSVQTSGVCYLTSRHCRAVLSPAADSGASSILERYAIDRQNRMTYSGRLYISESEKAIGLPFAVTRSCRHLPRLACRYRAFSRLRKDSAMGKGDVDLFPVPILRFDRGVEKRGNCRFLTTWS